VTYLSRLVLSEMPQVLWEKSWDRRLFSHLPYSPGSHCYLSKFNNILRRLNGSQGNPAKVHPRRSYLGTRAGQRRVLRRRREKEKAESVTVGRMVGLRSDRNVLISLIKPTIV